MCCKALHCSQLKDSASMERLKRSHYWSLFVGCAALCGVTSLSSAATWFVRPAASGAGNGTSWANASSDLQSIITNAAAGDQVWVAAGTYLPTYQAEVGVPRSKTFLLQAGVKMYGGFFVDGTHSPDSLDDANPSLYPTTLSGDIGTVGEESDNVFHVVTASGTMTASTILDGFTITKGWSAGISGSESGGGININDGAGLHIHRCVIEDNTAGDYGGGVHVTASAPTFTLCTMRNNGANGYGGGMAALFGSDVKVISCVFTGNSAGNGGGIAVKNYSLLTVVNSDFHLNSTYSPGNGFGGGIGVDRAAEAIIINCTFAKNNASGNAGRGGGFAQWNNEATGASVIKNCIFWGNAADTTGTEEIYLEPIVGGTLTVAKSTVQGGYFVGTDIDTANPEFVNYDSNNFRLGCTSPCINAATTSFISSYTDEYDLDGDSNVAEIVPDYDRKDRNQNGGVDKGAYEKAASACPGDATGNMYVDIDDLLQVITQWSPTTTPDCYDCPGDIHPGACSSGNGIVDIDDLLAVIFYWGKSCILNDSDGPQAPEYVDDCWDLADAEDPTGGAKWASAFEDCIRSHNE
jgi:predicted outer membrane repeat protein